MSISRHPDSQVRSYSITHPAGRVSLPTRPGWDYVVFAHSGVFTALTDDEAWTIPAHRALCVPNGATVRIDTTKRTAIRCLYVDANLNMITDEIRVVSVTPLTRTLLAHAIDTAPMRLDTPARSATITLLTDRLAHDPDAPLQLPLPDDTVARNLALAMMSAPADDLDNHLQASNASRRTLERRFKSETQMSLGQWRRRARILAAVGMLAQGESVTRVATDVGYSSPSSFVSAFRAELGAPPREFMASSPTDIAARTIT